MVQRGSHSMASLVKHLRDESHGHEGRGVSQREIDARHEGGEPKGRSIWYGIAFRQSGRHTQEQLAARHQHHGKGRDHSQTGHHDAHVVQRQDSTIGAAVHAWPNDRSGPLIQRDCVVMHDTRRDLHLAAAHRASRSIPQCPYAGCPGQPWQHDWGKTALTHGLRPMTAPTAFSHPRGRQVERMSTGVQMWGVTPPISLSGPTEKDLEITQALEEELRANNVFESSEEAKLREVVLGRVDALVKEFVYRASIQHGLSENAARASGGKIFTFGSYRLGVHGPGSDIDTLCVAPKHVQREDFFEIFEALLKERDDVTEVAAVPEAYVPLIKTKFMGISIDFLFARIPLPRIDDALELRDDNLLKNLDERDVRSLGGSRVTDEILRLVPNVHVFRLALRCIKLWAGRRAIYANVLGFLGGVAWAMLVARICQLYPNEVAGAIVSRFFLILLQWKWPQPVLLKPIEDGPLPIRVWNPRLYPTDRLHRMPIITPAYPSMCATHNVTQSTQMVMTQEFQRGSEIVDRIFLGKATWKELFEKHDFFHRYKYYLQVIASSGSADLQLKWEGTVESKLRQLIMKLELVPSLLIAHPFVDGFNHECVCYTDEEVRQVATGEMPPEVAARSKLQDLPPEGEAAKVKDQETQDNASDRRTVYTTTFYIGLKVEPRQAHETSVRRFDISYPTLDFTQRVKQWDQYDESAMGIVVRHIKGYVSRTHTRSHLPDYVFEGDPRPRKGPSSKRAKNKVRFFYLPSAFRFGHRGRCEKNQGVGGCAFDHPRIGFDVIEAVHGSHSVMYHTCGGPSRVCMGHLIDAPPLVIGASIDPTRFAWPADSSCARTSQRLPHCAGH